MYRPAKAVLALFSAATVLAQPNVHQVIVLNEGYFDMGTQTQVVPVTLGSYDPMNATYQSVATINGPRFASDVEVKDGLIFVAADDRLLKYDADTYDLLDQETIIGIRQLALWNDKVLLTRGELGGLPHYFEVRDGATLDLVYAVTPADGLLYSAEDVEVLNDRAYLAVGNAFDWGNLVGKVVTIDLVLGTYENEVDLGPNGLNPENIMISGTDLFVLNNKDFTGSSISRLSTGNGALAYTADVALNSGCGASVIANDHVYYMEYAVDDMARFNVMSNSVADTLFGSIGPYGLIHDPVNNVLYGTTTDFFSSGELHVMDLMGNVLSTTAVGVSPGRMALDLRNASTIDEEEGATLTAFPNPATDTITLNRMGREANIAWELVDAAGRTVRHGQWPQGVATLSLELTDLQPGSYLVRATDMAPVRFVKR